MLKNSLADNFQWIERNAEALSVHWGEDSRLWECSIIFRGERFSGFKGTVEEAVNFAVVACKSGIPDA